MKTLGSHGRSKMHNIISTIIDMYPEEATLEAPNHIHCLAAQQEAAQHTLLCILDHLCGRQFAESVRLFLVATQNKMLVPEYPWDATLLGI